MTTDTTPQSLHADRWSLLNEMDTELSFLRGGLGLLEGWRHDNAELLGSDARADMPLAFISEGLMALLDRLEALQTKSWKIEKQERAARELRP